ncbi:MAG: polysaccharide biosynthesis tyrosine autokinase [Lachnospiraceae bacterium]|nr:polysaccharide biosynthesis tyrosine autokinase [Lachnospiraceae bacterium]
MEQDRQKQGYSAEIIYNIIMDVAHRWHIILLSIVFCAVAADIFMTVTYEPKYETALTVVLDTEDEYSDDSKTSEITEALGYILGSNVFTGMVKEDMGVKNIGTYKVENVSNTAAMKIKATANSPETSYNMMRSMMKKYRKVLRYVVGDTKFKIIDDMRVPTRAVNPIDHKKNLALFGLIGAALSIIGLAVQSYIKDTIKTRQDVKGKLQIRSLACIETESKITRIGRKFLKKRAILVSQMTTSFTYVETFKRLASRVEDVAEKNNYKSLIINSTWEDEGKTSVAANLAMTMAKMGRKVLIIDTDFGKPALHKIMQVQDFEHGLEEVLRGEISIKDAIYHNDVLELDMVFVKRVISDSTQLLEESSFSDIIEECKNQYDYILIDTPPASYIGLSMITATHADAVILVARQNFTPTIFINRTIESYIEQGTPVLGCVLNRSMPRLRFIQSNRRGGVSNAR